MLAHTWEKELIDGGLAIGEEEFWLYQACGLSGGPVDPELDQPTWRPFLAGYGLGIQFSADCSVAREEVLRVKGV